MLQPIQPGEAGAQLLCFKGYGLEVALCLAALTGSAIYTDVEAHWEQLHLHAQQSDPTAANRWNPVMESLRGIDFPIYMDVQKLYDARRMGASGAMRAAMRRFAEAAQQSGNKPQPDHLGLQFKKAAKAMKGERADEPPPLHLTGQIELSVPAGGFERNDVRRLLVTFGRAKTARATPFAMLIKFEAAGTVTA